MVDKGYPDYGEMLRYSNEGQSPSTSGPVETTVAELTETLKAHGLEGRDVMVHASYRCLRPVERGPQGVVDAFVDAVGLRGRLLFPTYDFKQWSEEHYWDRQESPSRMGVITETARTDPRFERTTHPMLSYAVYAAENSAGINHYLANVENSHGYGSLFDDFWHFEGLLVSVGALTEENAGFDANNVGFTFIHHAETIAGAPHRRMKRFGGIYVDGHSADCARTYDASVRCPGYRTAVSPAMQAMEDEGVIQNIALGRSRTHIGSARAVYDWVQAAVLERPELLREVMPLTRGGK